MNRFELLHGDCLEKIKGLENSSVDAVVTDPPYELGFMGKKWDASGIAYDVGLWREVLRVLKPGGHLLAFGGTRTYHRMAVAIEDAGFEIRDSIHWIYGSGFPKSLDVSKAIDKAAGAKRPVVGVYDRGPAMHPGNDGVDNWRENHTGKVTVTAPATDAAKQWQGFGTALKPSHEPVVVARKPLIGTVAQNVLEHGTGAINVDGCRCRYDDTKEDDTGQNYYRRRGLPIPHTKKNREGFIASPPEGDAAIPNVVGRWPPNTIFSHLPKCGDTCAEGCAVAELDGQSGTLTSGAPGNSVRQAGSKTFSGLDKPLPLTGYGATGGASRFFPAFRYQAKAAPKERKVEGIDARHPTQKPVELMRWLVRLVTPPGGLILDPFMGSGTTGVACLLEGFRFIGCEQQDEYLAIAKARIEHALRSETLKQPGLFDL